jgi:hypothetical protein
MILEHYSAEPLVWPPRDYEQTYHKPGWGWPMKPEGFWVSVKGDDDWPSWCRSEEFGVERLKHCTRIHLAEAADMLVVEGEEELLAFDAKYGKRTGCSAAPPPCGASAGQRWPKSSTASSSLRMCGHAVCPCAMDRSAAYRIGITHGTAPAVASGMQRRSRNLNLFGVRRRQHDTGRISQGSIGVRALIDAMIANMRNDQQICWTNAALYTGMAASTLIDYAKRLEEEGKI